MNTKDYASEPLKIMWVGFHMEGHEALVSLLEAGIPIDAVLTSDHEAAAKRCGAVAYDSLCARFGVPLHKIRSINDKTSLALLGHYAPDVVIVLGWSQIIGLDALRTAKRGFIGEHASYLPRNRGSAPVNWAILRGESQGGNTLMWLSPEVDAGDIIDQTPFDISIYDTRATVYKKVSRSNRDMLLRLIPRLFAGETPGRAQPPGNETILPRRRNGL